MAEETNKSKPPREMEAGLLAIKDIIMEAVANKMMPGAAFLLAHKSKIIFEEYTGISDLKSGRPFDRDTLKFYASSTKPVSVSAVMALVDEGKINLDDPISKYLPEFSEFRVKGTQEKVPAPTIAQCLSMTSGIFGFMQASPAQQALSATPGLSLAESARLILREDLAKKPGTFFAYSNASFQVAGLIAELVTGQPFEEIVKERICQPLDMNDSMFSNQISSDKQWGRLETVYLPNGSGYDVAYALDRNKLRKLVLPAGSMVGTCRDYIPFLQMHLNGGSYGLRKVLSTTSVDTMRKVRTSGIERDMSVGQLVEDYGLGWFIMRADSKGQGLLYRHGGQLGTTGWIDRDRDLVAFWAANVPSSYAVPVLVKIFDKVQEIIPGPRTPYNKQETAATEAVEPPVIAEFDIEPHEIRAGETAAISWFVTGLELAVRIEPEIGNLNAFMIGAIQNKGIFRVSPKSTTTYTLVACNSKGEATRSVSLKVI